MGFALFCIVFGIVFYGFIIARVAAGLANADAQRARYQERLDGIKNFLKVSRKYLDWYWTAISVLLIFSLSFPY